MGLILLFQAFIQGIVEGLTEFLPVSSTGHLIISADLIGFDASFGKELADVFDIVIQLGAILAVCWEYRHRLWNVGKGITHDPVAQRFAMNLFIAFLPAAILGLLFIKAIKAHLFQPFSVAIAFIVGGLVIFWLEKRKHTIRIESVDEMRWADAFKLGCAQCLALIPGTSRSGATIMGGLFFGLSRKAATEFSFFLAIPTMFAATLYETFKHWHLFHAHDFAVFAVGFVTAFVSAFFAVRGLLKFIAHHSFVVFAWYRVIFGILLLVYYRDALFQALS
jgi:undecaprenyl-diphosphatase